MTDRALGASNRPAEPSRRIRAILGGQFPFVVTFCGPAPDQLGHGALLAAASDLHGGTAKPPRFSWSIMRRRYAETQNRHGLFQDADRTLLAVRGPRVPGGDMSKAALPPDNGRISSVAGGIALIAPDGRVLASTPHANTAGWPLLMAQLANSNDTVLAMGEPVPGKARDI